MNKDMKTDCKASCAECSCSHEKREAELKRTPALDEVYSKNVMNARQKVFVFESDEACSWEDNKMAEEKDVVKTRADRVRSLAEQWVGETFVQKNRDYGSSYTLTAETLELWFPDGILLLSPVQQAFYQLLTRMLDKLIRTSNLVLRSQDPVVTNEKAYETIGDNGVYSFMTAEILKNGFE